MRRVIIVLVAALAVGLAPGSAAAGTVGPSVADCSPAEASCSGATSGNDVRRISHRIRWRGCGYLNFNVHRYVARGVGCRTAERVIHRLRCTNLPRCSRLAYRQWRCRSWATGTGRGKAKCSRGRQRIIYWISD
ncbi:MAG: hypothetical protein M9938_09095 [Solirubrobacterales bacterium]|nr:hypothetical protein [Solirubrobacterales bacterium]